MRQSLLLVILLWAPAFAHATDWYLTAEIAATYADSPDKDPVRRAANTYYTNTITDPIADSSGAKSHLAFGGALGAGYRITPWLALEASRVLIDNYIATYDITSDTAPATTVDATHETGDLTGYTASVVGSLPINNEIAVFARAGAFRWQVKTEERLEVNDTTIIRTVDRHRDTSAFVGIGFAWELPPVPAVGLRFEWRHYKDIGQKESIFYTDVQAFVVSYTYVF